MALIRVGVVVYLLFSFLGEMGSILYVVLFLGEIGTILAEVCCSLRWWKGVQDKSSQFRS